MRYWLDARGNYYEGDRAHALDIEVPQRPSPEHRWDGSVWVEDAALVAARRRREVDEQERAAARMDTPMRALLDSTPEQIETWVGINFPSITPAEEMRLAMILKILAVTARGVFR